MWREHLSSSRVSRSVASFPRSVCTGVSCVPCHPFLETKVSVNKLPPLELGDDRSLFQDVRSQNMTNARARLQSERLLPNPGSLWFLDVTGLDQWWRTGALRPGVASERSPKGTRAREEVPGGPSYTQLSPELNWTQKALLEACPPSPGPGSERIGSTDQASAPGTWV